jgi:polyhydroxybutyrate depolymerase
VSASRARYDVVVPDGCASRRLRHGAASIALLSLAIACSTDSITAAGESGDWHHGTTAHATVVGALNRTFLLHVPSHQRLNSSSIPVPFPLVIVLHGSSGDASAIEQASGMDSLADAAAFLVAYPNGTGGDFNIYPSDWNAGTCCGGAFRDNVDDIGFITALIKEVSANVPVDSRRVYVTGFSAGGRMAYHAGCQLASSIAAIGVVSGSLVDDACTPTKPVALFAVHGTDDPEVAYDEGAPTPPGPVPPLADSLPPSVQFWTALNGCTGGTTQPSSADVVRTHLTPCTGADIDFYAIQGGTHGWPGGPDDPGAQPPMNELKASVLMWQFLVRHVRR